MSFCALAEAVVTFGCFPYFKRIGSFYGCPTAAVARRSICRPAGIGGDIFGFHSHHGLGRPNPAGGVLRHPVSRAGSCDNEGSPALPGLPADNDLGAGGRSV